MTMFPDYEEEEPAPESSLEELAADNPRSTDSANADAIVVEHGKGYRYVVEWDAWIAWSGTRWELPGARGRVLNAAMLTARLEYVRTKGTLGALQKELRPLELDQLKNADRIEELQASIKYQKCLLKWHEQSQNVARLEAAAKILQTRLVVSMVELDQNPWLFNVTNGTLDLRTTELRAHDPADLITQVSDIEWSDSAVCPQWDAFVSMVMGGKRDMVCYLQRLVGYSLTSLTTEHILAFFYGGGLNGKSTFMQAIRLVFGEYACAAPRDLLFQDKHGQRHPDELARLYGKRLAVCAEIGEYSKFDEAKVKDLTGGDVVAVRRMRENFWDLTPTHTLFISGNHKPDVTGDDLGIWRRVRLVPWTVTIPAALVDKNLPEKLRRELPGILRWAANGCLEWQRLGLVEPQAVIDATADYRSESDVLGAFLSGHVVFETDARCSRMALREHYESWCKEAGHFPLGARKLSQRLREHGVTDGTVREGMRVKDGWVGVRLKSTLEIFAGSTPDPMSAAS